MGPEAQARALAESDQLIEARETVLRAIEAGDWTAARRAADRCCALTEVLSPPASPSIGVERARLGKLLAHDGRLEHAKESWRHALRILEIAHGSASNLVRSLRADLSELDAELRSASAN